MRKGKQKCRHVGEDGGVPVDPEAEAGAKKGKESRVYKGEKKKTQGPGRVEKAAWEEEQRE